jgi:acyl carrier protein
MSEPANSNISERVLATIRKEFKFPEDRVTLDSTLEQLGLDSLDLINLLFAIENEFKIAISDEAAREIRTVQQIVDQLEAHHSGAGAPSPSAA